VRERACRKQTRHRLREVGIAVGRQRRNRGIAQRTTCSARIEECDIDAPERHRLHAVCGTNDERAFAPPFEVAVPGVCVA